MNYSNKLGYFYFFISDNDWLCGYYKISIRSGNIFIVKKKNKIK